MAKYDLGFSKVGKQEQHQAEHDAIAIEQRQRAALRQRVTDILEGCFGMYLVQEPIPKEIEGIWFRFTGAIHKVFEVRLPHYMPWINDTVSYLWNKGVRA